MNKKSMIIILILILSIFCLIGTSFALNASSISVLSISKIGIIDIELSTYTIDDNVEIELQDSYNVTSDVLSYIPKVTNTENSGDCYIRLKAILKYGENEKILNEDNIENLNDNFVYSNDGYFYYKEILKSQETVKAFDGIKLTYEILSNEEINIEIEADAIQAKNFTPDFTNLNNEGPWKNISSNDIKKAQSSTNFN